MVSFWQHLPPKETDADRLKEMSSGGGLPSSWIGSKPPAGGAAADALVRMFGAGSKRPPKPSAKHVWSPTKNRWVLPSLGRILPTKPGDKFNPRTLPTRPGDRFNPRPLPTRPPPSLIGGISSGAPTFPGSSRGSRPSGSGGLPAGSPADALTKIFGATPPPPPPIGGIGSGAPTFPGPSRGSIPDTTLPPTLIGSPPPGVTGRPPPLAPITRRPKPTPSRRPPPVYTEPEIERASSLAPTMAPVMSPAPLPDEQFLQDIGLMVEPEGPLAPVGAFGDGDYTLTQSDAFNQAVSWNQFQRNLSTSNIMADYAQLMRSRGLRDSYYDRLGDKRTREIGQDFEGRGFALSTARAFGVAEARADLEEQQAFTDLQDVQGFMRTVRGEITADAERTAQLAEFGIDEAENQALQDAVTSRQTEVDAMLAKAFPEVYGSTS